MNLPSVTMVSALLASIAFDADSRNLPVLLHELFYNSSKLAEPCIWGVEVYLYATAISIPIVATITAATATIAYLLLYYYSTSLYPTNANTLLVLS